MDIADRVRLKSDRPGRMLVVALCVAPVAAPAMAIALNFALKDAPHPAMGVEAPGPPQLRAAIASSPDPIFSPQPMGAAAARPFERSAPQAAPAPPAVSAPQRPARARLAGSHVLRNVTVVDGLRIAGDGMVVTLAGLGPVPPGSECKRLDGVVEPCEARAANRLDILTRGRPVVCDLRDGWGEEVRGVCRAGKIDLADDLVRNGLAVRTNDRP